MKNVVIIFSLILLIPLISANGIYNHNPVFNINKTYNTDFYITFQLTNQENFNFHNITFEQNDIVEMPMINNLNSGQSMNVTAKVKTNNNFNGLIKIKGLFFTEIGQQNFNHQNIITFSDGLSLCDFTAVKGDSITFKNQINDTIDILNLGTDTIIHTIGSGSEYTMNLNVPQVLHYTVIRHGFMFADSCTITTIDDYGYVNDPVYDTNITFSIRLQYNPTTVSASFLDTNFTMDITDDVHSVFNLKNTGNEVARDIRISHPWMVFDKNNFSLNPGDSTNIGFQIIPILTDSNDTAKNHRINLLVEGNFPNITQPIDIYINYAEINDNNITSGEGLIGAIAKYCNEHPEVCVREVIIYKYLNNGTGSCNATIQQDQVQGLWTYLYNREEDYSNRMTYVVDTVGDIFSSMNQTDTSVTSLLNITMEEKVKREEQRDGILNSVIIIFFVLSSLILGIIAYMLYQKRKAEDLMKV